MKGEDSAFSGSDSIGEYSASGLGAIYKSESMKGKQSNERASIFKAPRDSGTLGNNDANKTVNRKKNSIEDIIGTVDMNECGVVAKD